MDNIAKHAKNLKKPFLRSPKSNEIIISAKELANLVLQNATLLEKHRKSILSQVQWFISEADGKHKTRYRSKRVVELATNNPRSTEKINHEHVFTRKEITVQLLKEPHKVDELLDMVLGCIVTKAEHDRMNAKFSGWERYKNAGIEVLDMSTVPPSFHEIA